MWSNDSGRFPALPLLPDIMKMMSGHRRQRLQNTVLVCGQHMLSTTGSLIECMLAWGALPENVFVLGKVYSTNAGVLERLRQMRIMAYGGSRPDGPGLLQATLAKDAKRVCEEALRQCERRRPELIIVLDDGAYVSSAMRQMAHNWPLVVIEQTTSGIASHIGMQRRLPVVEVGSCYVKREVESPMIGQAIVERCIKQIRGFGDASCRYGVIGLGAIGSALVEVLRSQGRSVHVHDEKPHRMQVVRDEMRCRTAIEVVCHSDVTFGCTGEDCVRPEELLPVLRGVRTLASCSSGDIEFRRLLTMQAAFDPVDASECPDIEAREHAGKYRLRILRSGYPVNFDNSPHSVPTEQIQLTRGLLCAAVVQAVELSLINDCAVPARGYRLLPCLQRFVVSRWAHHTGLMSPGRLADVIAGIERRAGDASMDGQMEALVSEVVKLGRALGFEYSQSRACEAPIR